MRRVRLLLSICLAPMLFPATGAFADKSTVESVRRAWDLRQRSYQAIAVTIVVSHDRTTTVTAPASASDPFAPADNDKRSTIEFIKSGRRVAFNETINTLHGLPVGEVASAAIRRLQVAFDGSATRMLATPYSGARPIGVEYRAAEPHTCTCYAPLVPIGMWLDPEQWLGQTGWKTGSMAIAANSEYLDDGPFVRISIPRATAAGRTRGVLDVTAGNGFLPVGWTVYRGDRIQSKVSVAYDRTADPVIPQSWTYAQFSGADQSFITAEVTEVRVNPPATNDTFEVPFPIGARVTVKEQAKPQSFVRKSAEEGTAADDRSRE